MYVTWLIPKIVVLGWVIPRTFVLGFVVLLGGAWKPLTAVYSICVTSVCQSKQPLWWSPVRWMDHPAVCDMMRGSPSFLLSILYHWNAVICRMQTVYLIYSICVTSMCQSRWPLWWSLVHWMDHWTVCDMIRGPPSSFLSILHQWRAVICRNPTVHHIYV